MRSLPLALLALASTPALASGEELVQLRVGEARPGFGTVRPICDAPSVAIIEAGVMKAIGPGETLCSAATIQAQGMRRIYRVVVKLPEPAKAAGGRTAGTAGAQPEERSAEDRPRRDPEGSSSGE